MPLTDASLPAADRIRAIIALNTGDKNLAPRILDSDPLDLFFDGDTMDSLDKAQFLLDVEDEFGIEILDADLDHAATVGAFADLVERQIREEKAYGG